MKSCIPYSEYNPNIHEIVSGHDTLEGCLLSCDCSSSSSAAPQTLYYNAAVNNNWATLGNWWTDDAFTVQATALPNSTNNVVLAEGVLINSGSEPTVANLTASMPDYSDSSASFTIGVVVTGVAIFNRGFQLKSRTTLIFGKPPATYTGIIKGNAIFNMNSFIEYGGSVTGDATFNDYSRNDNSTVNGNATFNDYSSNEGTVDGDATFNDISYNNAAGEEGTFNYGTVSGNANFNESSYNLGTVSGNANFNDCSFNEGVVVGVLTVNRNCPSDSSSSSQGNFANYSSGADWDGLNGNFTTVGTSGSRSAYGTYDQSGNNYEWNDMDGSYGASRAVRGGYWKNITPSRLSSDFRFIFDAAREVRLIGFRVASRLNPFSLPGMVLVGDAGNAADADGYGSVAEEYRIGRYEVTNDEYTAFLNAVASVDTYSLYCDGMSGTRGGIIRSGVSGSYSYSVKPNYGNKPVNWVSWFDCARYCNWLHNGSLGAGSTEDGSYTLAGAVDAVSKNASAKYHIPTENEWHKAAYYKGGGLNAGYWLYATQSDNSPTPVSADETGNAIS